MKNPWLGLASYTEDSLKEYGFYGRKDAIAVLKSMIERNLFVTLYGKSGIGKTSLLQAGVFPLLRLEGMPSVVVRFADCDKGESPAQRDKSKPAAQIFWEELLRNLSEHGISYVPCSRSDVYIPDYSDVMVLRYLFSAGRFLDADGVEKIPVSVFDQFEEFLYHSPGEAETFMGQIYALIDDNCDLSLTHPLWHDDTNFRIVVSIREDDLFLFEDLIDRFNFLDLKSNRYRLMPLTIVEAREVVMTPGRELFEKGREDEVGAKVIALASSETDGKINTLMLSLICTQLFNKYYEKNGTIALKNISDLEDIIETFYIAAVKGIPTYQRYYLEDNLVDEHGRRKPIYEADMEIYAPKLKALAGTTDKRILNISQGRVELIHDQLAATIGRLRNSRKGNLTKRIGVASLIALLAVVFFYSFSMLPSHQLKKVEHSSDREIAVNNDVIEEYIIDGPTRNREGYHVIKDCPNLKRVVIKDTSCNISIYHCPSLIDVVLPKINFSKKIRCFNCLNLKKQSSGIVFDELLIDSNYYTEAGGEYLPYSRDEAEKKLKISYESAENKLKIHCNPYFPLNDGYDLYAMIETGLSDSEKRKTTLYVPYGLKEEFTSLIEFQPFLSIEEMPRYRTWEIILSHIYYWYSNSNIVWLVLSIIGVCLVQIFFWISSYFSLKQRRYSSSKSLLLSALNGIGMSLMTILSFMAPYWLIYNLLSPYNQVLASIVGVLSVLICLLFVYKNVFYRFWIYIRTRGFWGATADLKNAIVNLPGSVRHAYGRTKRHVVIQRRYVKRRGFRYIFDLIKPVYYKVKGFVFKYIYYIFGVYCVICLAIWMNKEYESKKHDRERYIAGLEQYVEDGQYGRAYFLADELLNRHASRQFPFFAEAINRIKKEIEDEKLPCVAKISAEHINRLMQTRNIPWKFEELYFVGVSDDGDLYCFASERQDSIDRRSKAVIYRLSTQSVDTVPNRAHWGSDWDVSFSPSGRQMLVSSEERKTCLYDTGTGTMKEIYNDRKVYQSLFVDETSILYKNWGEVYYSNVANLKQRSIDQIDDSYRNVFANASGADPDWNRIFPENTYQKLFPRKAYVSDSELVDMEEKIWQFGNFISSTVFASTGNWSEPILFDYRKKVPIFHSSRRGVGNIRYADAEKFVTSNGLFDIASDSLVIEDSNLYYHDGKVVNLKFEGRNMCIFDLGGNLLRKVDEKDHYINGRIVFTKDNKHVIDYS